MIAVPALRTEYPLAIRDKIERLWRMCAFGAPFGSVFQPVFGGGEVAEVPWYLLGDIPAANCLAAHQPLGAANLAASYDDIAHVATTWDCAPGTAPTFDPSYGWGLAAASSQYLFVGSNAIVNASPFSTVCLFNVNDVVNSYILSSICKNVTDVEIFHLALSGTVVGDPVRVGIQHAGTSDSAATTTGYTAGTWYVACGVFTAANNRAVYINGSNKGTTTTSVTPTGVNKTYIGVRCSADTLQYHLDGKIAADAWYDIALSDAQALAVSNALLALVT